VAFEIRTAPRGPGAFWNGKQLTSAYAPAREAATWAEGSGASPGSLVIVAGDPWGLAAGALVARGCRAAALLPGPAARPLVATGTEAWCEADGPLEDFLTELFDRWGPEEVRWEVWPAFERQAPELSLTWAQTFRDLYRTVQGSWLTQSRFGPRFWRNAVRNAVGWDRPVGLVPGNRPVVIAASGPSLDDGLEALKRHRDRFDLWALPSSFETLVQRGLVPDAGVATDGGYYAREHLQRLSGTEVPLMASLSSAPDPTLVHRPVFFFAQGQPVEEALLAALLPRHAEVPSQGTVAVTALRLALEATSGPVFIAGLDLSFRGLRGHTSPHTVDRREAPNLNRLTPGETLWAQRTWDQAPVTMEGIRTSPAMVTYAGWFRSQARFSRPVTRIAPSPLRWPTMDEVSWDRAEVLWQAATGTRAVGWTVPTSWPSRDQRTETVRRALGALARRAQQAPAEDPWLTEAARTAVPEALARDWRARRQGRTGGEAQEALAEFVKGLLGDLG